MLEWFDYHQRLAILDWLAVLDQNEHDTTAELRFDLVHHLHCLDDSNAVAGLDSIALLDIRWILGRWRSIEGADHWRGDRLAVRDGLGRLDRRGWAGMLVERCHRRQWRHHGVRQRGCKRWRDHKWRRGWCRRCAAANVQLGAATL